MEAWSPGPQASPVAFRTFATGTNNQQVKGQKALPRTRASGAQTSPIGDFINTCKQHAEKKNMRTKRCGYSRLATLLRRGAKRSHHAPTYLTLYFRRPRLGWEVFPRPPHSYFVICHGGRRRSLAGLVLGGHPGLFLREGLGTCAPVSLVVLWTRVM